MQTRLHKPLLVEGPAGVRKTELAKAVAAATGRRLLRLPCYEGQDDTKALYEWDYGKQLLYTQILREKIGQLLEDTPDLHTAIERIAQQESAFFSERFLAPRPLLEAVHSADPVVLLIDEVDRADKALEAVLLEMLAEYRYRCRRLARSGPPPAVRHPHLEQHPRPVRRAQAPLPAPVSRLSERRTRAGDFLKAARGKVYGNAPAQRGLPPEPNALVSCLAQLEELEIAAATPELPSRALVISGCTGVVA